ncbi:NADH-ubiquinone oxidoreductase-F iron-sulfur binding region domain-containing protein [Chloroflexota bacterium]
MVTLKKKLSSPEELEALRGSLIRKRETLKHCIAICSGTGCLALGCADVIKAFEDELDGKGLSDEIEIRTTGCPGFCEQGPVVVIQPENIFYQRVKPEDAQQIISETVLKGNLVNRLLYIDPTSGMRVAYEGEIPFYKKQQRLLLANNMNVDPKNIEDYIAMGGYKALQKALLHMTPEEVLEEVKRSGLRGRGGGGFPTGRKWETCRDAGGDIRYVIVNADEGDPGAFMDRAVLEGNPHSVLEGLVIGAFAIGANQGYVYVRHEYPLAVENIKRAISQAEDYGLLGSNILGSGFSLPVDVTKGAGAFICGESTALMASLKGKVGKPRAKYTHTVEKGLWDKPSDLNNVETWANVPLIISKGADWYSQIGTEGSKGTKIFSLVGKIKNTGLVEVPMGMTLREVIFDIGGGIPRGKQFKAVQTGGPSGGCIPQSLIDLPVDFDELTKVGSMMGSGAMIVMDENTCMVDVARYFLNFLCGESCGKCVPCREGIKRMLQILEGICHGKGSEDDLALLEELSKTVAKASLCALGGSAPNPVLTTLKYFPEEYQAHVRDKKCPAGVCKELTKFVIDDDKCMGCRLCIKACPMGAITWMGKRKPVVLDQVKCIKCGSCYDTCLLDAIKIE